MIGSNQTSANEARAKISFGENLPSIELDNLIYKPTGGRACYRCCDCSKSFGCLEFPRRLISVSGLVVSVEEISQDQAVFSGYAILRAICIPSSVEKICEYCFNGCNSLSTITFESDSKLSCIEGSAFSNCSSLSSICIPSSVEKICESCFKGCNSISTITFESDSKLSCIEGSAFSSCSSLSSIYVPSSLQPILYEYVLLLKLIVAEHEVERDELGVRDCIEDIDAE
jgi:hypothetical protein